MLTDDSQARPEQASVPGCQSHSPSSVSVTTAIVPLGPPPLPPGLSLASHPRHQPCGTLAAGAEEGGGCLTPKSTRAEHNPKTGNDNILTILIAVSFPLDSGAQSGSGLERR